jgi:hypothetical protein
LAAAELVPEEMDIPTREAEHREQAQLFRDIFFNPFRQ